MLGCHVINKATKQCIIWDVITLGGYMLDQMCHPWSEVLWITLSLCLIVQGKLFKNFGVMNFGVTDDLNNILELVIQTSWESINWITHLVQGTNVGDIAIILTVIIEQEPKFIADAIGPQILALIKQKIAKALGLILSMVTNRDLLNALHKVNGELGLNGRHAQ